MPKIQVPISATPRQIEFDETVKRSKPGALYFTPGSVKIVTQSEMDSIKKHHAKYASSLIVLSDEEPVQPQSVLPVSEGKPKKAGKAKHQPSQSKIRAAKRLADAKGEKPAKRLQVKSDGDVNKIPPENSLQGAPNNEPPSSDNAKKDGAPNKSAK
jgi:hypothetical protein